MRRDHLAWLKDDDLEDGLCVTLHVVCLDSFLYLEGSKAIVSLEDKESGFLDNFNPIDSLVNKLFAEEFVFLIDVDDIDPAFVVCSVQLLLLGVPVKTREDGFVRVAQFVLSVTLALRRFKPFQGLVIADREYQVLLHYEKHLNHTDPVDQVLLELQSKQAIFVLSPGLKRFENVDRAF